MADDKIPQPDASTLDNFLRAEAKKLREKDQPPATRKEWHDRRATLIKRMREAMGPVPDKDCPLEPRIIGTLKRDGYSIEKVIFQSRPDIWVTASAYVPTNVKDKVPAVLVVHGHWAGARRDPVVQARCLGLVKLGFFVLAVDAFGAGERYTKPAPGTYHGALYGATLWPTGHTLLGMQVYDNRRAVDYLQTRPEVDGSKLGVTGASGGGNQTMYAGATDDRFGAVVPVCSVGNYQAYLHAACCVCEVLPGALKFTEEGDVLGLVAPRALMVINATQDGIQFSVAEAKKSIVAAAPIFKLHGVEEKLKHVTFESPHAYNKAMRETMYGWMTRWLKGEGKGEPIPEPDHKVETWDDLACFPDPAKDRPKGSLLLPEFAGRVGRELVKKHGVKPQHVEDWEARAMLMRGILRRDILGQTPSLPTPEAASTSWFTGGIWRASRTVQVESGVALSVRLSLPQPEKAQDICVILDLNGGKAAEESSIGEALLNAGRLLVCPDLRGTGATQPKGDAIAGAPDHNSTEHSLWTGRSLLGQWVHDVQRLIEWLPNQIKADPALKNINLRKLTIIGIGPAGIIALAASAILNDRLTAVVAIDAPVSYVTDQPYAPGTRMGLLAPGILRAGDIPHLAALTCPRKLQIIGGVRMTGGALKQKELEEAFAFTRGVYDMHKAADKLIIKEKADVAEIVKQLG